MSVIREWREIIRAGKTPMFYKVAAEVKAGLFRLRVRGFFLIAFSSPWDSGSS